LTAGVPYVGLAGISKKANVPPERKLSYVVNEKVGLALVDVRRELTVDKKPPTYIGTVHGVFGIPQGPQHVLVKTMDVERLSNSNP
jgi:hypothetical protein